MSTVTVRHPSLSRRNLLLGGMLLGTAAVTFARLPRTPVLALTTDSLDNVVPEAVGAWRWADSDDIVLPPEMDKRETAAYDHLLTRDYSSGADASSIMLLVAYDRVQSGMLQIHRPEACYPAAGYKLSNLADHVIELAPGVRIPARTLTAVNGARTEQILYWTRIGNEFPVSYDAQRASVATQNLHGLVPDGALVRVSIIDDDADASRRALLSFVRQLYAGATREGQALLAGPMNAGRQARTA